MDSHIRAMIAPLKHRGPDSMGVWVENCIALGHSRLAILDLSPKGHQPMVSKSGRFVIVFNGEIYNHLVLREQLQTGWIQPDDWQGHSDTETLLASIEVWGLEKTLEKSIGMFAMAVWDRQEKNLFLVRDRLGEKPLYYGWQNEVFLFASELKAIKQHPSFAGQIDRNALLFQLRYGYIPGPYSIYKGIRKLPPGTLYKVSLDDSTASKVPVPYWSFAEVVHFGSTHPFIGSDEEAIGSLENLLKDAVGQQMLADVPLGAFLSGGVDSSTIVALMQSQSSRQIKTFSIGFNEAGYNEALYAKAVAQYLGTEHTDLYVSSQQALDVIPRLPLLFDEPFSDVSQIPTFLVSSMTRQHVTVALSGDGGDELFGGYNRYTIAPRLKKKLGWLPFSLRFLLTHLLAMPPQTWWNFLAGISGMDDGAEKVRKICEVISAPDREGAYQNLVSHWKDPFALVIGAELPSSSVTFSRKPPSIESFELHMMAQDTLSYLPDDILVKVDRAAMAVSLETRVPFLDHRVVEFAWRLPLKQKIRHGQGKWILRQVLYKYVPKALIERPKKGFAVPLAQWLRGPLRHWAEALLDESRLQREGYFHPPAIRSLWKDHLTGKREGHHQLWDVLMFQAWLEVEHRG